MSIEILLQNINFSFIKGKKNVDVLENISFEVAEKEFVSIVGPSGCGKTTLLKIISGLYNSSPTYHLKGKILVKGKMPSQCRQQNEFGFVFQNPVLLAWKTVLKNIELPIRILQAKMPTQNFWQPEELLDMVGLKDFKNAYPFELSGGMQQRVALAMALVFKPSILLLDEPFRALDEITREKLNIELLKIKERTNATIVLITHSLQEAVLLSDKVLVLSARPSTIKEQINISLPKKRTIDLMGIQQFIHYENLLRDYLKEEPSLIEPLK